ncbi:MAG: hypothetical protein ABEJ30_06100 [Halorientalis sp.]
MPDPGRETEYTLSDVLEVFTSRDDPAEPLTATEVADALGCSRRTALNKLHELAERTGGSDSDVAVTSKKVGGRSRVWWLRSG